MEHTVGITLDGWWYVSEWETGNTALARVRSDYGDIISDLEDALA
jgi:hypothetical protein